MSPRRNHGSLERIKNPIPAPVEKIEDNQVLCPRCGRQGKLSSGYFYPSKNPNYAYVKAIPFCKSCLHQIYQTALVQYKDEYFAFKIMCAYANCFYSEELIDELKTSGLHRVGEYMKRMNLAKYSSLSFENNLISGDIFAPQEQAGEQNNDELDETENADGAEADGGRSVPQKVINMFGDGYTDEDYKFLFDQYKDWVRRYDCNQKSLEEMIKSICLMQLNIRNASKTGADISKLVKSLNDTISAANLQPITDADEKDSYSYGQLIDKFEENKPIDEDPQFKDYDGIAKYVGTWFFGALTRIFGKRNEFSDMYDAEIAKYTVTKPHYEEDENLSTDDIFGDGGEDV